jgi:hypothetical protein
MAGRGEKVKERGWEKVYQGGLPRPRKLDKLSLAKPLILLP